MGRGRAPCCERMEVKRGWWTAEEDGKLVSYIQKYGHQNWRTLPKRAGLQRCGKSCRLRWVNYLRPGIKHGNFTQEEEHAIIELHRILGNQWAKIASSLPGRTDNEIKNIWNTYLRKRTIPQFCDPLLKSPRTENPALSNSFEPQNCCVISPNTLPANPFELPAAMEDNALVIPFNAEFWNEKDDRFTGPATSACAGMDGSFVIEESERWLLELVEELGLLEEEEGEWMKKEGMAVKEGELVNNFM